MTCRLHPPPDAEPISAAITPRRSSLPSAGPVVLTGANGAGKTNLIEAISLLAPGRGLRRATMEELAFSEGDGAWAVSAEIEGMLGLATLGTGIDPPAGEDSAPVAQMPHRPRSGRPRRRPSPIICAWCGWCRPWTRCSTARPPSAAASSTAWCWRSMRSIPAASPRSSARCARATACWKTPHSDSHWLDAVEHETAEVAVAVAAARAETVAGSPARSPPRATGAGISRAPRSRSTAGWRSCCPHHSAIEIEDRYRALLKDNRARDAAAGRTLDGPHLSDLARHPCRQGHCRRRTLRPASRRRC